MTTTTPTQTPAGELDFLGARCRVLADSAGTAGRYGLVDMIEIPAGHMPPLHLHRAEDEGFLVLDGEITLYLPGREVTLRAGEFFLAPRAVPHTYRVGDAPARTLVLSRPGGFEGFVADVAALDEVSPETLGGAAAAHDIVILGPPGAMP
jgi:quercetin dioxygenase-like cupin family protein